MHRAAMIVFSYYYNDPRVRRAAEALVENGMSVDVICLRSGGHAYLESSNGVRVISLPVRRQRKGLWRYLFQYATFSFLSFLVITAGHFIRNYSLVHVHNMPDFLVFSALIPRLTGSKVILDLHDPTPEVFMTLYSLPLTHPAIRALMIIERASIGFAHLVLTPNKAFWDLFTARSCSVNKIHIVMNSPQASIFQQHTPSVRQAAQKSLSVMYHGTIVKRHGLETALEALAIARNQIASIRFDVYGSGNYVTEFLRRTLELGLQENVSFHGEIRLEEIPQAIRNADVGVVPNLRTPFTEINLPTRIFEYLSQGKPVIAPSTRGITDYFNPASLFFFEPGQSSDLARCFVEICTDPQKVFRTIERGIDVYKNFVWEIQKRKMIMLVSLLMRKGSMSGHAAFSPFARQHF